MRMLFPKTRARCALGLSLALSLLSFCGSGSPLPLEPTASPGSAPPATIEHTAADPTAVPTALAPIAAAPTTDSAGQVTLQTRDGLTLVFDRQIGRFVRMDVQGQTFSLPTGNDLAIHLFDPRGNPLLNPQSATTSRVEQIDNILMITRENRTMGVQAIEKWIEYANHIDLEVTLVNTDYELQSRAIEACLSIPIDMTERYWYHHFDERERIIRRNEPYKTVLQKLVDIGSFGDSSFHLKTDIDINLNGLNLISDDRSGLALSINPERPAAYYVRYDTQRRSYDACFHLGVYNEHIRFKNTVSFALSLFVPDEPAWGLRSAYAKYIAIYPQAYAGRLPRKTTMVVLEEYRYDAFPDPRDYRIGAIWGRYKAQNRRFGVDDLVYIWPHGYYDRGMRLRVSPSSTGSVQTWEADIAACFALYEDIERGRQPFAETCTGSYPFATCTRQRSNGQMYGPVLEREQGSGWRRAEAYQMTVSNGPNFLIGTFRLPAPFEASLLQDADGRWLNSISFASLITEVPWEPGFRRCIFDGLNPDPGIDVALSNEPRTTPAPTIVRNFGELNLEIVKRANGLYGPAYLDTHPDEGINLYHGVAVDTVGVYLRPDFNPRALRTASLPLSYDRATGRVVALEHLTTLAFLRALRASLPADAPIATSGAPISGILYQDADYVLEEFVKIERNGRLIDELYDETLENKIRLINRIRMGAYQRPITFSVRFERASGERAFLDQINRYLPLYTAKGVYINIDRYGANPERYFWSEPPARSVVQAYQRHLHMVHALNVAGWQPIPYATASRGVLVERFGRDYVTVYNPAETTTTTVVTVNWRAIGFDAAPRRVVDAETDADLPFDVSGDYLTIDSLSVGGLAARILRIDPPRWTVLLPMVIAL
ncbi:conserved hypothetical protein [Roseiflexus castenholzii DSM 13941]|jgi:hypothetical protein|uniref:Uncharacterized protein n=1 Tax=Roseiflexus castenholzii (strain DSM 13941 / HLO8) TaxID=383372 RepID=A7NGN6_ROSCS|nr:conserved hypothetical protein [Roseiflexus castenholzii DSM 13941]